MTQPLTPSQIQSLPHALTAWGEAEFQLRAMVSRAQSADLWPTYQALCVRELTCSLYQSRGLGVTADSLSPAYDLLRHGRPLDFDLLYEARHTRSMLAHYYNTDTPITDDRLDVWLRAMIELANTIGTYEPSAGGPLFAYEQAHPVFDLPPGPLEALRTAIRTGFETSPPLLALVGLLNGLEAFEPLFPTSLGLAVQVLLPGLVSYGFKRSPLALFNVSDEKHWVHLDQMAGSATSLRLWFDEMDHSVKTALARADHQRTGSRLPSAVAAIWIDPVFTAQSLAQTIGAVGRTTEKLVSRLEKAGIIHPLQRSGRLIIWSKR